VRARLLNLFVMPSLYSKWGRGGQAEGPAAA
jgi:hypothetical protein